MRIITGDVREVLPTLETDSFDCCVTSPPYFGLRDYGCEGQIGLEATLDGYLSELVAVFREVRRVLKPAGMFWLNIGDSYARDAKKGGSGPNGKHDTIPDYGNARRILSESRGSSDGKVGRADRAALRCGAEGVKQKNLLMVPNRLALALQADGWYVRSEIIWHKPNPMPESVRDRPTSAHEKVWLLTKSERYFFDADAVREPDSQRPSGNGFKRSHRISYDGRGADEQWVPGKGRNIRNVWTITPKPFKGAHFATFPPELVERCIKAGCPVGGHVLDPFGGAGTTGMVADALDRDSTLIELNPTYAALAFERVYGHML